MKEISDTLLTQLAGEAAFARGVAYYRDGRVDELTRRGRAITALVNGSEIYQVTLKHTEKVFEGSCDCPASEGFDFCKHCVATALAYREELVQEKQLRGAASKDRLPTYLMTLDKQTLVDMLLERLQGDRPALAQLQLKADLAAGKLNDKTIRKQITAATPLGRHLFGYAQVRSYFSRFSTLLDGIGPLIVELPANQALALIGYAFERMDKALETIDDSGGFRLPGLELLGELHLCVLKKSTISPTALAEQLFAIFNGPLRDFYPDIPSSYLELLGDEGMRAFLDQAQQAWDALPPLTTRDWNTKHAYHHLSGPLLKRAKALGDIEAIIALHGKMAVEFSDHLTLSALCLDNDRLEQALWWRKRAEEAASKPFDQRDRLDRNQIAIWLHQKDYPAATDLLWKRFARLPTIDHYHAIIAVPDQRDDDACRAKALALAEKAVASLRENDHRRISMLGALAQLHLCFEQPDRALALAEAQMLPRTLLVPIAEANANEAARALALIYRAAEALISDGTNNAYKEAVETLKAGREIAGEAHAGEFRKNLIACCWITSASAISVCGYEKPFPEEQLSTPHISQSQHQRPPETIVSQRTGHAPEIPD